MAPRIRVADVIAACWTALAVLTAAIGVIEYEERGLVANVLRVVIVVLMVATAFLLVRHDLKPRK